MSKKKDRRRQAALYAEIRRLAGSRAADEAETGEDGNGQNTNSHPAAPLSAAELAAWPQLAGLAEATPRPLLRKFRFQLLHRWIVTNLSPGRVADVGGGKGLLAYLLQRSGWQATVIDPQPQALPLHYKDLASGRRVRIPSAAAVARLAQPFTAPMAQEFDLLVALHAHGCNLLLLEAAATYRRQVILLPCCLIDEPLIPPPGVPWIQAVADYARRLGLQITPFRLNFKGQNIGLYTRPPG
jgi:SAM-dependent methyltransferase